MSVMQSRILVMKLLLKFSPSYNKTVLSKYSRGLSLKDRLRIIISTGKRILKGKV